jgi:hypothetical protein
MSKLGQLLRRKGTPEAAPTVAGTAK